MAVKELEVGCIVEGVYGEGVQREYYFITCGTDNKGLFFMPIPMYAGEAGKQSWMYKFRKKEEIGEMFNRQFGESGWGIAPNPYL